MSDLRKEFEALSEIKQNLRYCHYNESTDDYHADIAHDETHEWHTQFVNGAWDIFQERQKKIDAVLKITNEYWLDDDRDYHVYIQRIEEALK